ACASNPVQGRFGSSGPTGETGGPAVGSDGSVGEPVGSPGDSVGSVGGSVGSVGASVGSVGDSVGPVGVPVGSVGVSVGSVGVSVGSVGVSVGSVGVSVGDGPSGGSSAILVTVTSTTGADESSVMLAGSIVTPSHSTPETDGLAVSSKETSSPAASSGPSTTVPSARTTRSPDSPAFGPALTVHLTVNSASSGTRPAASPSISLWMENVAGSAADRHSSLPENV